MFSFNPYDPAQRELASDLWIQQHVPGGLAGKSAHPRPQIRIDRLGPLGRQLDVMMGGSPNPTGGQMFGAMGFGSGYGYHRAPHGFF